MGSDGRGVASPFLLPPPDVPPSPFLQQHYYYYLLLFMRDKKGMFGDTEPTCDSDC